MASETESIRAIKVWLSSIGANMTTFVLHPIGDSAFVSWPPGVAATKAPSIPHSLSKSHADYVLLIKPTVNTVADAPENERQSPQGSQRVHAKLPPYLSLAQTHRCMAGRPVSNSMGPDEQKAAYGVPLTAKGTNETNLQMVFGTGTFGFRSDDLQVGCANNARAHTSTRHSFTYILRGHIHIRRSTSQTQVTYTFKVTYTFHTNIHAQLFYDTYAHECKVKDVTLDMDNKWKGLAAMPLVKLTFTRFLDLMFTTPSPKP